jgi:hypothetical protein
LIPRPDAVFASLFERVEKPANAVGCEIVKRKPGIDLYKELLAHGFGEVFPNLLTHSLTNPFAVFSLRWTTAQDDGGPAFNPGYGLG